MKLLYIGTLDRPTLKRLIKELENGEQLKAKVEKIETEKPSINSLFRTSGEIRQALIKRGKDIQPELEEYEQNFNQEIQEQIQEAFDKESDEKKTEKVQAAFDLKRKYNEILTQRCFATQVMPFVNKAVKVENERSQGGRKSWGLTPEEREERNILMQKEIYRLCLEQNKTYNYACLWVSNNISKIYPKQKSIHERTVKELTKSPKK